jgi:hypothetical protein
LLRALPLDASQLLRLQNNLAPFPAWRLGNRALELKMKIHASADGRKVVVSSTCQCCDNGAYDVLRPCPGCGRSVLEKRNLRASQGGTDTMLDSLLFGEAVEPESEVLP